MGPRSPFYLVEAIKADCLLHCSIFANTHFAHSSWAGLEKPLHYGIGSGNQSCELTDLDAFFISFVISRDVKNSKTCCYSAVCVSLLGICIILGYMYRYEVYTSFWGTWIIDMCIIITEMYTSLCGVCTSFWGIQIILRYIHWNRKVIMVPNLSLLVKPEAQPMMTKFVPW